MLLLLLLLLLLIIIIAVISIAQYLKHVGEHTALYDKKRKKKKGIKTIQYINCT